jgi:hypothetical protein
MCSPSSDDRRAPLNLSVHQCPEDVSEVADLYCLHRLTQEEERVFEEHYLQCPACVRELERSQRFIAAIKPASSPPQAE